MFPVSVIIPTYNGEHKILNVLDALQKQTFENFEVIVVVDGSTDGTKNLLNSKKFNFKSFRVIEQSNQGRARVRNNGARLASGQLLVFFDDDMIPLEDCLMNHILHQQKFPNSILTGGILDFDIKVSSDIQKYKSYISIGWSEDLKKYSEIPIPKASVFISTANLSIPKILFDELLGFDESLTDAEDYDMAVRAFKNKTHLYYNHQAFAWHCDPITCYSYIKRLRQYKASLKQLQYSKPDLYAEFELRKVIMPTGIKALVFKLFTHMFWIKIVDQHNWLLIFPKYLRYKIYTLIITANGVYYTDRLILK